MPFVNIYVLSIANKKLHSNRACQQFLNAPCNRVTPSLQKRKHHKSFCQKLLKNKVAKEIFFQISFSWRCFNWSLRCGHIPNKAVHYLRLYFDYIGVEHTWKVRRILPESAGYVRIRRVLAHF